MSAVVTLKIVSGALDGAEYVYREPGLLCIGRGSGCALHIPNHAWYQNVSRHHCLLEIDPPEVRVCDLGSLNGTFVNGESIGQRERGDDADRTAMPSAPDHPLCDGDELRIGDIVFRISIDNEEPKTDHRNVKPACQCVG